jgi:type I restriction enzyme S subunit
MNRWNTRRIDQLGRVVTGKTPPSERPEDFGDQFPFITPSDIPGTQKYITTERFLSEKGMESFRRMQLPAKSVCVVCIGATIGKVCQVTTPSVANQQINSIVPTKGETDADFAYYLSTTLKDALVSFAGGSATPIINKSAFSAIKVQVPEYSTQRKIAAVLAAYDDLIEANRRRITLLERMAEEIYREWFVRLRFPGHATTKITKGLPAGWTPTPTSELFNLMSGGTPDTDNPAYWDGIIPFFTPKDAHEGSVVLFTEKHLTEKGLDSCNSPLFPKHTLFITARGTVGNLCIAHYPMAMNQSCYALSPKMSGPIFWHFLALKNAITYLKGVAQSGVFDNIVLDTFKVVPIFWPGERLVTEFNKLAQPMFEQLGVLLEQNAHLTRTRDLLLPRLISGKLPVESLPIAFPPSMADAPAH